MFRRDKLRSVVDEETRFDLEVSAAVEIRNYEEDSGVRVLPCDPKQLAELKKPTQLEAFIKKRMLALKISGGIAVLGSVIGFLAYSENSSAQEALRQDKKLAIEKILQNPDDLKVLDICQQGLRGEAHFRSGYLRQLYEQAAVMEDKLHFNCEDISEKSILSAVTVVLPYIGEVNVRTDDILPVRNSN